MQHTYHLTMSDTTKLIKLRTENNALFDGKRNGAKAAWSLILKEMGLEGIATTEQLSKKWENMKRKYKELKCPAPGMEKEAERGIATWHWFSMLDRALGGQFPSPPPIVTSGDDSARLPTKRLCLGQVGNAVQELLPHTQLAHNNDTSEAPPSDDHGDRGPGIDLDMEMASLRRDRLGLEREQAEVDRERQLMERERDLLERERIAMERDRTQLEKDWGTVERDRAAVERDKARLEKDLTSLERDKMAVSRERQRIKTEHEKGANGDDASTLDDRQKLRHLFEKLIEKF